MKTYDFLIVGAGIYGITAALALRERGHSVAVLNAGPIPDPLAASTDISKVVRMEYGTDRKYMDMVEAALAGWRDWNGRFGQTLYHEVGFLMLSKERTTPGSDGFERSSYENLLRKGYAPEHLNPVAIERRFPAFAPGNYAEAFFNPVGGYAESGRVVETLAGEAVRQGADLYPGQSAERFEGTGSRVEGVRTREGERFSAGQVVVCTGVHTPYLLPELKPYFRITGHPIFHLRPSQPELFRPPHFTVFTGDISRTGWYGFPLHPRAGVVKIANHGIGQELHPDDARVVTAEDESRLREFLRQHLPALAEDPIVYTRCCLYDDTLDGHFWIDRHPDRVGLSVAAGGSGHALKMAPVLGELIADVAEGKRHRWSDRYGWRELGGETQQEEEARFKKST